MAFQYQRELLIANTILPDFEKFLLSRGFDLPKNVPFYATWVSRFIAFSNRQEELKQDLLFEKFLDKVNPQKSTADPLIVFTQRDRFKHNISSPVKGEFGPAGVFFLDIVI
jgi:hypothetical protein